MAKKYNTKMGFSSDGCWQQLHGSFTPSHACGCAAQCCEGVQRGSIIVLPVRSSPASCHACFAARCCSLCFSPTGKSGHGAPAIRLGTGRMCPILPYAAPPLSCAAFFVKEQTGQTFVIYLIHTKVSFDPHYGVKGGFSFKYKITYYSQCPHTSPASHSPSLLPVGAAPGKTCFGKEVVVDILVGEQFSALYEGFQNAEVDFLIRPFIFRCCAKVKTLIIRLRWKISGRWGIMEASPKEHVCQRAGR